MAEGLLTLIHDLDRSDHLFWDHEIEGDFNNSSMEEPDYQDDKAWVWLGEDQIQVVGKTPASSKADLALAYIEAKMASNG